MNERGFRIATEALREEARTWRDQGSSMTTLGSHVDALHFFGNEGGVLRWAFEGPYEELVDMVALRCSEAEDRMEEITQALFKIAGDFEAFEDTIMQEFRDASSGPKR
jgi:hypothetical protein